MGYYTFVAGKLWIGIRYHSGAPSAYQFTRDNILYQSLTATPLSPTFNWLLGQFGDEEFAWALNTVGVYDMDAATLAGNDDSPQYTQNTMSFVGVSNKSQCARIVTTRLREEIGGVGPDEQRNARNFAFRTTLLSLQIMCGDIVGMNSTRLPNNGYCEGRVQSWVLNPDFSIDIKCTATTDSMYDLDVGPKPVDGPAAPIIPERLQSINGLTWMPNELAPVPLDPLYPDPMERTFDVWQDYQVARDGTWEAAIWVSGEMCINDFAPGQQPRLLEAVLAPGGNLDGPMTVYLAITQRTDDTLQPLTPSNLVGLWIPPGVTGQKMVLNVSASPDSGQPWDLWAGNDRRAIAWQSSGMNVQPIVNFLGPIHPMTKELPEAAARKVAIAAKKVWHSGRAGVSVSGVTAPDKIQCNDFIRTTGDNGGPLDDWVGSVLTALADQSDGSAPLWNFTVTAFDQASGTFTVSPDCVRADPADSVQEGDVLIVRSFAIETTPLTVRDPMWNNFVARNQFQSPGLRPGEEVGRILRIVRGPGAGQYRYITANDPDTITIATTWDVMPTADSVMIVEAPDWTYQTESSDLDVLVEGTRVEIRMRVENLSNEVALVAGFLVDDQGRYTDEIVAPMREIFIFAEPPGVRDVGPGTIDPATGLIWTVNPEDQTIRVDTSGTEDVTVLLLPLADYHGRTLYFTNDNGPSNAIPDHDRWGTVIRWQYDDHSCSWRNRSRDRRVKAMATVPTRTWIYDKGSATSGGGGGGGGGGVPAPDVIISPDGADVIFRSDHNVEVDVTWEKGPTATDQNFAGVAVYLEDPDISSGENLPLDGSTTGLTLDGSSQVSGDWLPILVNETADSPAVVMLDSTMGSVPGKTFKAPRDVRIYLVAYSPGQHPHPPIRATDPNPTPNIMVNIPQGRNSGESGAGVGVPGHQRQCVGVVPDYNPAGPAILPHFLKYTPPDEQAPSGAAGA